ncbi:cystathionine beta-lyase family protein involved in aluminum resistance [Paenibacillus sp. SORGH_AS306]|uniref:methionine gamma-lyase family protein n=1 Tax=unclassified Paenibacillus TaxID=185978 RepID=UPI002789BFFA|nr:MULTISPECIES: methionine gamma-lyase family protein [unclassified Paenibacillus]MDQ1234525.1 cystathionine beta-lyase family protein involved in aluminum resistance [Paenibacillus sp. SORGH_AS_0306]MDR6111572.1 cystathionine beta-lyase family protein involved in aluminum resistance [Paenibacillus sp. SORGH_AS_0338]
MAVFDTQIQQWSEQAQQLIGQAVQAVDQIVDANQWKVIEAFQKYRVSDYHFAGSTGYAYNDRGREVLESVYAEVFGSEAALVRPHFASGTHTIATAMFGILRPGDELLYITGRPYDTLHKVIGKPGDGTGSLADFGITYQEAALNEAGQVNWATVKSLVHSKTKMIGIQRSRGYDWRASFTIEDIAAMVVQIREICPQAVIFVDNCYGEFTETREPTDVGVDLMAGSLIKNPGGGLAETGGYICGKQKYVDLAAYRLTAPGIGGEVGAMLGTTRSIYQGLYMAPTIVGQAVKGSIYAAAMFELAGFNSKPAWQEKRTDLIQAVSFKDEHQLIAFVQGIQRAAAVDSHVVPEPWDMPGYDHPVIMAAGTFIQGGSLELSADAPIRAPYIGYMQGGLTFSHVKLGVLMALQTMHERGLL